MRYYRLLIFIFSILFHTGTVAKASFDVKGVNEQAEANIKIFLKGIKQPSNIQNLSFLNQVQESTNKALIALGYYNAVITADVKTKKKNNVIVQIVPGPRTRIVELDLQLKGEGNNDPAFSKLINEFAIHQDDYLNHGKYTEAKNSLLNLSRQRGYFDAKYEKSTVDVTAKANSATVHLWFDTGVRYQFGELTFTTDVPADKEIEALQTFKVGDPFEYKILREFNADLHKTGYFKSITIVPEIKVKSDLKVPLTVVAIMRPQDSFNIGLGYSTDQEIRSRFRWTRPWVNDYGHSIEANIIISAEQQESNFTYKMPVEDAIYNYTTVQLGYKNIDQNDTDTEQYIIAYSSHWKLDSDWLLTTFIKYDYEFGVQGQQDYSKRSIIPGISFSKSRQRGGINPYWGDKKLFSLEFSDEAWLSDDDFIKAYGQYKLLRSINKVHQFFINTEFGAIYTDSIKDVPSSMRFFTGGDQTIRGYEYESIAPKDDDGYLVGGQYLAVGSLEYRYPIADNWKVALFADAGNANDKINVDVSTSIGVGVVWASPVGPIRLYTAKPFNDDKDNTFIHLMIGPEL